jgi:hypothetical protein
MKARTREKIFLSYSRRDRSIYQELKQKLLDRGLERHLWDDTKIRPSDQWDDRIREAMNETAVAVLILSDQYFRRPVPPVPPRIPGTWGRARPPASGRSAPPGPGSAGRRLHRWPGLGCDPLPRRGGQRGDPVFEDRRFLDRVIQAPRGDSAWLGSPWFLTRLPALGPMRTPFTWSWQPTAMANPQPLGPGAGVFLSGTRPFPFAAAAGVGPSARWPPSLPPWVTRVPASWPSGCSTGARPTGCWWRRAWRRI